MSTLIAGIGNVFLGDDGFGVEVAQRLAQTPFPAGITVADFGIRGFDLAFALERADVAILVDASRRGGKPGTLYVLDLADDPAVALQRIVGDPHFMTPAHVLQWIERVPRVLRLVACEPETFGEDGGIGLSPAVSAAVDPALALIRSLAAELTYA